MSTNVMMRDMDLLPLNRPDTRRLVPLHHGAQLAIDTGRNRLWPNRLWPKPSLAKTEFGQPTLAKPTLAKSSLCCVVCCVLSVWRGYLFHGISGVSCVGVGFKVCWTALPGTVPSFPWTGCLPFGLSDCRVKPRRPGTSSTVGSTTSVTSASETPPTMSVSESHSSRACLFFFHTTSRNTQSRKHKKRTRTG